MARFNDFPHPRILFEGVPDDIYELMAPMAAHPIRAEEVILFELHEYDLLVTFSPSVRHTAEGLHVLSFAADQIGEFSRDDETFANEVDVREMSGFDALAIEAIVPFLPLHEQKLGWLVSSVDGTFMTSPLASKSQTVLRPAKTIAPLVVAGQDTVMAGMVTEMPTASASGPDHPWFWLLLPPEARQHPQWLAAFISFLHDVDPQRFPGMPEWQDKPEWGSAAAVALAIELGDIREQRARVDAELASREAAARDALTRRRTADRDGPQRLLTAGGDDLVDAVHEAFEQFGFIVQDMDAHHTASRGSRLEDLRITAGDRPQWTSLTEVKGYTRGASVNDLAQLMGRPTHQFVADFGRTPDALWQVVNVQRNDDPSIRRRAIDNDRDLDHFAEAGGVLIDTRDVFRALRDLESGATVASTIRDSLLSAKRRWMWPSRD